MTRPRFITGWMAAGLIVIGLMSSPCLGQRRGFRGFAQQRREGMGPAPKAGAHPPRQHAGDWLRRHQNMSPAEREKALENDPMFRRLPPAQQQLLRERLQHFSNLPAQQQERMLNRMDTWEHLTPEQKEQARQIHGQMQQLAPDRQRMVRTAIGDLRAMPPAQREQIIDSERFKGMFSPQERDIMRGAMKLPLAPPEAGPPE
jgi:Protein of unknown function (DUF3106)